MFATKLLENCYPHIFPTQSVASQCHQTKKVLFGFVSSRLCCAKKRLQGDILSGKAVFPICNASDAGAWLGCIVMHSHGKFVFCSVNVIWDICSSTLSSSTSSCSDDDMFEELAGIQWSSVKVEELVGSQLNDISCFTHIYLYVNGIWSIICHSTTTVWKTADTFGKRNGKYIFIGYNDICA